VLRVSTFSGTNLSSRAQFMKINGNLSGAAPALLPLGDAVFIKVILLAPILENARIKRCLPGKFGIERSSAIVRE